MMAAVCHGHGAYHDVVAEITRALQKTPDDAALRFKLACAHQEHGEWTSALAELERVERVEPDEFETGLVQGKALATGGQWQASKAVLDDFLETHPGHAEAQAQRARVLLKLGQGKEALADFRAALEKAAEPTAELFLEAADAFAADKQPEAAVLILRQGLEKLGADPGLVQRSLDLELASGHFDAALACVDALQKAAPRPEPWMARRAQVLAQAGRADDAKAAWAALRDRLLTLPNLERGMLLLNGLLAEAQRALGAAAPAPVIAPPAS